MVTTRRSILGPPAEGRPGPSDDNDDDDGDHDGDYDDDDDDSISPITTIILHIDIIIPTIQTSHHTTLSSY